MGDEFEDLTAHVFMVQTVPNGIDRANAGSKMLGIVSKYLSVYTMSYFRCLERSSSPHWELQYEILLIQTIKDFSSIELLSEFQFSPHSKHTIFHM